MAHVIKVLIFGTLNLNVMTFKETAFDLFLKTRNHLDKSI